MSKEKMIKKIEENIEFLGFLKCESEDLMIAALEFGNSDCFEYQQARSLRSDIVRQQAYLEKKLFQLKKMNQELGISSRFKLNLNFQFAV